MGTQMEWLFPWQAAHDESNGVDELYREVSVGHPLYGTEVRSIAYREDCDYALFALEDGTSRVVVVHLTFQPGSGRGETKAQTSTDVAFGPKRQPTGRE